jgi:hypothetical protein
MIDNAVYRATRNEHFKQTNQTKKIISNNAISKYAYHTLMIDQLDLSTRQFPPVDTK